MLEVSILPPPRPNGGSPILQTYEDFIRRVEELGFLPFSGGYPDGFPTLDNETAERQWHTGDPDTDPWQWKDRATEEKKLAFGCILNGRKGFVTKRLYPYFYAAYHPSESIEERYADGEVSQAFLQLYKLFYPTAVLSTAELRGALGVTKKAGASRADTAVKELQRQYYITVCGNRRKISYDGFEYGWPANTYCRVWDWAPPGWLDGADHIDPEDARSHIVDVCLTIAPGISRETISKLLFHSDCY